MKLNEQDQEVEKNRLQLKWINCLLVVPVFILSLFPLFIVDPENYQNNQSIIRKRYDKYWKPNQLYEQDHLVRDIDQTDLHRFEPSSRTLLMDEHSYS